MIKTDKYLSKISKYELVRGLSKMNFSVNNLCDACQLGKLQKDHLNQR